MRRNGALFWGALLIILGGLLLLQTLGLITLNVVGLIWPIVLILLGLWILWGVLGGRRAETEQLTIPLKGASEARVRLSFGAGRLQVGVGAGMDEAVAGTFSGGVEHTSQSEGNVLTVDLRSPDITWNVPWMWGNRPEREWLVRLNGGLPLALEVRAGASDTRLDLTDLRVTDLTVKTGASSTDLTLPANAGLTRVNIEAGAASMVIRVPSGVAARLRLTGGVASLDVDEKRFPRLGGYYQSPDFDSAPNKIELEAKAGAGSVEVK